MEVLLENGVLVGNVLVNASQVVIISKRVEMHQNFNFVTFIKEAERELQIYEWLIFKTTFQRV